MSRFQIGRIVGPWTNFLPPIQGGHFRRLELALSPDRSRSSSVSSSRSSSCSGSPTFEPQASSSISHVRRRQGGILEESDLSSLSSYSSVSDLQGTFDKKSDLSDITRREINHDLAKYPSLDPITQAHIVLRYRQFDQQIREAGLYQCNYRAYIPECCRYLFLFGLFLLFLRFGWYGTSGLFLACFWHQLVFTAHDAGHMGISHDLTIDTVIGIVIGDFLGGLSLGWWKRSHNVHHIVTNSPEHDPDIEHMPVFAISHRFFDSLRSTYHERVMSYDCVAKFAVQIQHYLYYPLLALGRFNLYFLSWDHLILGRCPRKGPAWWHRWLEIAGQVFFWAWFGYGVVYKSIPTAGDRMLFILVSHMATGILHVQITLSHFAMSTADLGIHESFPQKMLRTTMDVDCPEWLDFFHGGLQFQAVHHLYPRIPRHNLRQTQKYVQAFCEEVKIPYALYGFVDGNKEVLGRLAEVGKQARILAECQRAIIAEKSSSKVDLVQ